MPCETTIFGPGVHRCPHPAITECSDCRFGLCSAHIINCETCDAVLCGECIIDHNFQHALKGRKAS